MDIAMTEDQIAYRDRFRAWLDEHLPRDWDWPTYRGPKDENANAEYQKAWERKLYEAGYAGIAWPKEYGGQGLTHAEHLIVSDELGLRAAPEGLNVIGIELVGPILLAVGTEEQKKHFIQRILRLDDVWCQGYSEPNAGSDLASLKTRAVRDGDDWVINGQKIWTSYAHHADMCILLARTDPDAPKHRGLSLFFVDMKTPGISIRPLIQITGRRDFNETFYDDVRVPDSMRIGEVNKGWDISINVLGLERATTRMHRNGRYMHEFNHLVEISRKPNARGEVPIENPHYRQRLAEIYADIEIHRYHNMKTVSLVTSGRHIGPEASIVKLFWSELHQRMSEFALDVLGEEANGSSPDAVRWRDIYLQSRADTIYAGTSQIQRNIIAERVLGLPR
jgi:alkylation response protein AidB-like acyl-CoA dehydrogenase